MDRIAIDTGFFLRSLAEFAEDFSSRKRRKRTEDIEFCKRLIDSAGTAYACCVPLIVPGEFLSIALDRVGGDYDLYEKVLKEFKRFILSSRFTILKMGEPPLALVSELGFLRDHHDRLIVACAMAGGCEYLWTVDEELISQKGNIRAVAQRFGYRLRIQNPEDPDLREWARGAV